MNPAALRYYRKWIVTRQSRGRFYGFVALAAVLFFGVVSVVARAHLGDWSSTLAFSLFAAVMAVAGCVLVGCVHLGSIIGGSVLLDRLEADCRAGHFREVWRELMLRYDRVDPRTIASARFHELFATVGSDVIAHESLTPDQAREMAELLALARANLESGRALANPRMAKHAVPIMTLIVVLSLVLAALRFLFFFVR